MKRNFSILIAIVAWTAVITQYCLMLNNSIVSITETTIRFFSFFTILTNTIVACYFTLNAFKSKNQAPSLINSDGTLTSITIYITVVGLVYQVILRHTWSPTGIQKITDELLHSVIPVLVIVFWYFHENKAALRFKQIPRWLIYPLVYLIYILIRGSFSHFYPYPFVNVDDIGLQKALMNSALITVLFIVLSFVFIGLGKQLNRIAK